MQKFRFSTKKLCYIAVLSALFVLFDLLSIKVGGNIKITFGGLPIILAAVLLGPFSGMLVGLIGSFIGQMVTFGFTATTLLWIIPAGIRGLVMGLMFIAFKRSYDWKYISISIITSSLLVTVANTFVIFVDSKIYGYYSIQLVFGMTAVRILSSVLTSIAYIAITLPIILAVKKVVKNKVKAKE